jgi:hypothetical protein
VLYFAFDETDDFAHGGEYAAYLNSARNTDGFIGELWNYIQSEPFYKNRTTLILTTDHGRGTTSEQWRDHGANVANANEIWFAAIGPDIEATGEAKGDHQYYQNQFANTIATLLGLKFKSDQAIGDILLPMLPKK